MGIRVIGVTVGVTVTALLGTGVASALTPVWAPDHGIVGVDLNHGETTAFANGPIPGLLNGVIRNHGAVDMDKASQLMRGSTAVYADFSDVVAEAAAAPHGQIGLGFADPAQWRGADILVVQFLR